MKLKTLSLLVVLTFIVTLFSPQGNAFASTLDAATVQLNKSQKSASTRRISIYGGQDIQINVQPLNFGSQGIVSWAIFKNGKQYKTGVSKSTYVKSYKVTTGQYSIRIYCGIPTNTQTGCYSDGSIFAISE